VQEVHESLEEPQLDGHAHCQLHMNDKIQPAI
jgi:hypothetical protein